MPDPRRFTRAECESTLTQSASLEELVEALTPEPNEPGNRQPTLHQGNGNAAMYA